MRTPYNARKKIRSLESLLEVLSIRLGKGSTVVFTNGCFDILHAGHARYLGEAGSFGDILVLGLNSDESVKMIKGEKRPIVGQDHRAEVLAGLECVDFIVIFDEPDPLNLIEKIMPDVLVKGADWAEEDIIGADVVKAGGGEVQRIPFVKGYSTSDIIKKIVQLYA